MSYSVSYSGTLKTAENLSLFSKQVKAFSETLLLIPVFIILVPILFLAVIFYYPILLVSFAIINRKVSKIASWVEKEGNTFSYDKVKEINEDTKKTLSSLNKLLAESSSESSLLKRTALKINLQLERIVRASDNLLFVNVSSIEYTSEEIKMFQELDEFWGDKEPYDKDTFEQLKNVEA